MENEGRKGEAGCGPEGSRSVQGGRESLEPKQTPETVLRVTCLSFRVNLALKHNTL